MFRWIHHLLNPHCEHCAIERTNKLELERLFHLDELNEIRDNNKCESCETLREQLRIANHEKEVLLDRILEKPSATAEPTRAPVAVTKPNMVPWNVRRQMLEQEDRAKAVAMSKAAKPDSSEPVQSIEEIEKELLGEEATASV